MLAMTDPAPFDRRAVRLHRDRAAATVDQVAPILHDAAERLLDRLDDTTRRFTRALDVGGRGAVAPSAARHGGIETVSCDLSPGMARRNGASLRRGRRGVAALRRRPASTWWWPACRCTGSTTCPAR